MIKRYIFILPALLVIAVGCGSSKGFQPSIIPEHRNVHSLDETISDIIDEICFKLSTDGKNKRIVLLECFNQDHLVTEIDEYVSAVGKSKMGVCCSRKDNKLRLIKENLIREYIAKMDLSAVPEDIISEAEKWEKLGAEIVISSRWQVQHDESLWQGQHDESLEFIYEVIDTKAGGKRLFSVVQTVTLDDTLRKLMGQKLPGSLAIECRSSDAKVYVDGDFKGEIGSEGTVLEVPFGTHSLRIDKNGYTSFAKHFQITERSIEHVKVKFTQSYSAPVKGMISNAILPGSASIWYSKRLGVNNGAAAANGIIALLFYTAGTMWAIDNFGSTNFLTKEDLDKHNEIKNIELYSTLGCYISSVITGWIVGNEYRKVSKRGIEYSDSGIGSNAVFYVTSNAQQKNMFRIGVMFR